MASAWQMSQDVVFNKLPLVGELSGDTLMTTGMSAKIAIVEGFIPVESKFVNKQDNSNCTNCESRHGPSYLSTFIPSSIHTFASSSIIEYLSLF